MSLVRKLWQHPSARWALVVIAVVALAALCAPVLPLQAPDATALDARLLRPFSPGHLLGTDRLGRDILSRLLAGTRLSLAVAASGTLAAAFAGSLIGIVAGYYGRWIDGLLMRGIDLLMAFPYLLLALFIVAVLGPNLRNATLAIAIVNVPFFARTVRGRTRVLAVQDFIAAARVGGLSGPRILFGELLPNVLPVIVVACATSIGWMLLETAGLSFLGLGAQPPRADLGGMLGDGRAVIATAPHVTLIPGALIFVIVVALNFLGDGLGDILDPRRRSAGAPAVDAEAPAPDPTAPDGLVRGGRASSGSADDADALLSVRDLTLRAGGASVVDGVSFDIARGESVGLVGESGSGKSLTALAVMGLLPVAIGRASGRILFDGRDLERLPAAERRAMLGRRIGFVPQDPLGSLHPMYDVQRQIEEVLLLREGFDPQEVPARVLELLRAVQIPDAPSRARAFPHQLSGGMRQRVALAIALAADPDFLILDEPTTALDVTTQAQILDLLVELCQARSIALLFISHDLGVIQRTCERVLVVRSGHLLERAATSDLFENPRHEYSRALVRAVRRLEGDPATP